MFGQGGNDGEMYAFDATKGIIYCLLYVKPSGAEIYVRFGNELEWQLKKWKEGEFPICTDIQTISCVLLRLHAGRGAGFQPVLHIASVDVHNGKVSQFFFLKSFF